LDVKEKPTEELTEVVEIDENENEEEQIEAEVPYIFYAAVTLSSLINVTSSNACTRKLPLAQNERSDIRMSKNDARSNGCNSR